MEKGCEPAVFLYNLGSKNLELCPRKLAWNTDQKSVWKSRNVDNQRIIYMLCAEFENTWWELLISRAALGILFFFNMNKGWRLQYKLEEQHCSIYLKRQIKNPTLFLLGKTNTIHRK